jgi:hypothetical protein
MLKFPDVAAAAPTVEIPVKRNALHPDAQM